MNKMQEKFTKDLLNQFNFKNDFDYIKITKTTIEYNFNEISEIKLNVETKSTELYLTFNIQNGTNAIVIRSILVKALTGLNSEFKFYINEDYLYKNKIETLKEFLEHIIDKIENFK